MAGHDFGVSEYLGTLDRVNTIGENLDHKTAKDFLLHSLGCQITDSLAAGLLGKANPEINTGWSR